MQEVELKFQVPATRRAALDAAVAGRDKRPRERLQATYFDTVDRALARAGLALRLRREGRRCVQTLKGAGDDGITRAEHNVALPGPIGDNAVAEPALHAGTEVGARLHHVLAEAGSPPLVCLFRTDVLRRSRQLRTRGGVVELVFDAGEIVAGERRTPICEFEVELVRGSPSAVITTARRWALRHGLWLDTRTKAERGDLLARGEAMNPERRAQPVLLQPEMSLAQAFRCALRSCFDQISVNASQVASGAYHDEHVHQLRVGLRRLRTALRLFDVQQAQPELALQVATLFRRLGAARDRAAVAQPLEQELARALAAAELTFAPPTQPPAEDEAEPGALLRLAPMQALLLDLLALLHAELPTPLPDAPPLSEVIERRLRRWHRKVLADAARFRELDDIARHTMRKRAKSLRYGAEFAAELFGKKRLRRLLKPLRELQERLGELVDLSVALAAYRSRSDGDPHVLFALGWLAARKQEILRSSEREVEAFAETKKFWK